MPVRHLTYPLRLLAVLVLVAAAATACANRQEPARQAIAAIESELAAAGTAPAKFIPGELKDTQARLDALKRQYDAGQFDAVIETAPAVLAAARQLAPSAAARARALQAELQAEWTGLSTDLPGDLARLAAELARVTAQTTLPEGLDTARLQVARQRAADAQALWDQAQAEHRADRLPEAVTLANQARDLVAQILALPGFGTAPTAAE